MALIVWAQLIATIKLYSVFRKVISSFNVLYSFREINLVKVCNECVRSKIIMRNIIGLVDSRKTEGTWVVKVK